MMEERSLEEKRERERERERERLRFTLRVVFKSESETFINVLISLLEIEKQNFAKLCNFIPLSPVNQVRLSGFASQGDSD